MIVLAIDPGNEETAYVVWDGRRLHESAKLPNEWMRDAISRLSLDVDRCVIEQVTSYGMAVGASVFETCVWSGRFMELFGPDRCDRVPRLDVKLHVCHTSKANDSNIRQALIDRFGDPGTKKAPGLLYKLNNDQRAALALAVTWWDKNTGGAVGTH